MQRVRWARLLRFGIVGSIGFAVDAAIVVLLVRAGVRPYLARIPSLTSAIFVTWALNRTFTYRVCVRRTLREVCWYSGIALSSAFMNYLCYAVLVYLGFPPVVAVGIASVLLLAFSYYAYGRFAFGEAKISGHCRPNSDLLT
jgi:putative flippase GtrA